MRQFSIPEIREIGLFDSSIMYHGTQQSPRRSVRFYQLEMSIEDGGETVIDSITYPIRKGNIILARPGQMRNTLFPHTCYYIHFFEGSCTLAEYLRQLPTVFRPAKPERFEYYFKEIVMDSLFSGEHTELEIQSKILHLLYMLLEETTVPAQTQLGSAIIRQSLQYIDAHLSEDLSNEMLAAGVNMSKNHFQRIFLDEVKKTPHQYILERRIEISKRELLSSNRSLSEIAFSLGFSSQSHFGSVFRSVTGKTPLVYRKENASSAY